MKDNFLFKFISSIPVILVALYYIPFLGIILLLFRLFINKRGRKISTPLLIISMGILILLPKFINFILNCIGFKKIDVINKIISSTIYLKKFIPYSNLLITTGIIFLILIYIFNLISIKINNGFMNYIRNVDRKQTNIAKENDMKIRTSNEKAKNTGYVRCPYCGSDNIVSGKFGVCSFCRRKIENKNYK